MANDISAALQSAKGLTALLKQFENYEAYPELMRATSDLQERLSQALISTMTGIEEKAALMQRCEALAKENEELKNWGATALDYALRDLGYGTFAFVYEPKVQASKPPHWVCTKCFEDRKISILQNRFRDGYECPRCKTTLPSRGITATIGGA